MTMLSVLIITVIVTALLFDFVNGWNDSANAIATVVATRVMSPTVAVMMAAILNLVGAMVGANVADTMSKFIRFGPKHRAGLVAEYRSGEKSLVRIDSEIAFSWNDESPDVELPTGPFETTWRGFLQVKNAEKLRLHADVVGDVTIELDKKPVLKGATESVASLSSDEFAAKATDGPQEIPLFVTFRKTQPTAQLKLSWSLDGAGREPIPESQLLRDKKLDRLVVNEKRQEQFDYISREAALTVIVAALVGAAIWAGIMTLIGMPISGSHSLIGGVIGAGVAAAGSKVLVGAVIKQTLLAMLFAPLMGFVVAYFFYVLLIWLTVKLRPSTMNRTFGKLQVLSACSMGFTHGSNDAQKVMGIITMALLAGGFQAPAADGQFHCQLWVQIVCALAIGVGTAVGGWGVIKTLGHHLTKLGPPEGFAAETSAAIVLAAAAHWGVPTSSTHTITGSILGLGATRGMSSVRWGLGEKIVLAWVFTLPSTMMLGGGLYWVLAKLLQF